MSEAPKLSVVIAVQYAEDNLPEILQAIRPDHYPDTEFLFCYTDADPGVPASISGFSNAIALKAATGSLIPHLWAFGIRRARGTHAAITTAHVIPERNWIDTLLQTHLDKYAGVGGVIVNDPRSGYRGWAIYFLRYIAFSPPKEKAVIDEIAADNAVYQRDELLKSPDLLDIGFWEPSFHARFRQSGKQLLLDPDLIVVHRNRYTSGRFFGQRFAHGRAFGLARAVQLSVLKRWLLVMLSPVLPMIFLARIMRTVFRQGAYSRYLPGAFPWLIFFLSGWGLGEARGYLDSLQKHATHKQKTDTGAGGRME